MRGGKKNYVRNAKSNDMDLVCMNIEFVLDGRCLDARLSLQSPKRIDGIQMNRNRYM